MVFSSEGNPAGAGFAAGGGIQLNGGRSSAQNFRDFERALFHASLIVADHQMGDIVGDAEGHESRG